MNIFSFSKQCTSRMNILTLIIALIISVTTPFTYFSLEYKDGNERAAFYAQGYALKFQRAIQENPKYWQLNLEKFLEIFSNSGVGAGIEAIEVYDNELQLLHRETVLVPSLISIRQTAKIYYNNQLYGSVIIYGSLAHVMRNTIILWCLFTIAALIMAKLQYENQKIQNEIAVRKRTESILQTAQEELRHNNNELTTALATIQQAQKQLIQREKLAGIGQLAAGVAHEINNPLGFVTGNVEMLEEYFVVFSSVIAQYREVGSYFSTIEKLPFKEKLDQVVQAEADKDLDYIIHDLPELLRDTIEGLNRMSKIVKGMRSFSRIDQQRLFEQYDLINGLENTLLVANSELKHYATVDKNLGDIPTIEAVGGEINQVLLNLIVNAAQAIKAKNSTEMGVITIRTWHDKGFVYCAIGDSGIGIMPEDLNSVFNPFFTTKPVGQGMGMGLSISYDIIVNHHNGDILVESAQGTGAKFTVKLPIRHDL